MAQNFLIYQVVKSDVKKVLAAHSFLPLVSTFLIDLPQPSMRNIRPRLISNDDGVELLGSSVDRKVTIAEEV
jgi:hypothetical protein